MADEPNQFSEFNELRRRLALVERRLDEAIAPRDGSETLEDMRLRLETLELSVRSPKETDLPPLEGHPLGDDPYESWSFAQDQVEWGRPKEIPETPTSKITLCTCEEDGTLYDSGAVEVVVYLRNDRGEEDLAIRRWDDYTAETPETILSFVRFPWNVTDGGDTVIGVLVGERAETGLVLWGKLAYDHVQDQNFVYVYPCDRNGTLNPDPSTAMVTVWLSTPEATVPPTCQLFAGQSPDDVIAYLPIPGSAVGGETPGWEGLWVRGHTRPTPAECDPRPLCGCLFAFDTEGHVMGWWIYDYCLYGWYWVSPFGITEPANPPGSL